MSRPIGYYVHHHGSGHLERALRIAAPDPSRFVLLGTGVGGRPGGSETLSLADDRPSGEVRFDGVDYSRDRPQSLHYAPLDHAGVRARTAQIAGWIEAHRPAIMVVDVSVEVAMLARLAATPTVVIRLAGDRTDPAHLDAFRGAQAILAPFHADLEDLSTPDWVRAKTRYAPRISEPVSPAEVDATAVVVVFGSGGGEADGQALAAAARSTPHLTWRVLGPMSPADSPPINLAALGWVSDVEVEIARAGVVIGSCGSGVVGAVLAADRPFIAMPQSRPYDEQASTARALAALGAAIVLEGWPEADRWPNLLDAARSQTGAPRRRLTEGDDATDIHQWILTLADGPNSMTGAPG